MQVSSCAIVQIELQPVGSYTVVVQSPALMIHVMADIEQMFHQIQVKQADRDAFRFVWRNQANEKIQDYVINVHLFGKVDSPCCANWALKKSASDQKDQYDEKGVKSVNLDFYMDDFLNSQPTKKLQVSD